MKPIKEGQAQTAEEYKKYCQQELHKLPGKEAQEAAWLLIAMGLEFVKIKDNEFDQDLLEAEFVLPGVSVDGHTTHFIVWDYTKVNQRDHIEPDFKETFTAGLLIAKHKYYPKYPRLFPYTFSITLNEAAAFIGDGGTPGIVALMTTDGNLEISSPKVANRFVLTPDSFELSDQPFKILSS